MVDQSYSERQLFEKAYDRILSEFQIVLNLSYEDIQKKLNKALRRNLENQTQNLTQPTNQAQENQESDDTSQAGDEETGVELVEENPE